MWVWSPRQEASPGGGNSNPLSILARRIPWTEEPSGLQSVGSQKSGRQLSAAQQHMNTCSMALPCEGWVQARASGDLHPQNRHQMKMLQIVRVNCPHCTHSPSLALPGSQTFRPNFHTSMHLFTNLLLPLGCEVASLIFFLSPGHRQLWGLSHVEEALPAEATILSLGAKLIGVWIFTRAKLCVLGPFT